MKRLLLSIAASLCPCLCIGAPPDILPPGYKGVKVTTSLDLGALAAHVFTQYTIAEGDTLGKIAEVQLGSAKRIGDIVARNPELTPERLQIGQKIWLPPVSPAAGPLAYLFLEVPFGGPVGPVGTSKRRSITPLVRTSELPFSRYGSYHFHVVPEQHLTAFEVAIQKQHRPKAPVLEGEAGEAIVVLEGHGVHHTVPESSPVAKIDCTLKIEKDDAGKLVIRTTAISYGRDGKAIEAAPGEGGDRDAGRDALLLLLLAAGGGAFLLWRARRSRPQPLPA